MGPFRRLFTLSAVLTLFGGFIALFAALSPAASASAGAPAAAQDGWVRCAHLSPNTPAVDVYMYPFGNDSNPTVLRHVSYGNVSDYMAVAAGQYTVAMRQAGAPASSAPVLSTSFWVTAGDSYTVAGVGPAAGLKLQVLKDDLSAPAGQALVRVIQASLKEHLVTVSYGSDVLANKLAFGSATPYTALQPGTGTVTFTAAGGGTSLPVTLSADTVHTIVVLDGSSGLKVDNLTDAAGSKVLPMGGAATGFGGMASGGSGSGSEPWLLTLAAGSLLAAAGFAGLRRTRSVRAGAHR
jgi:Domain of unknown function (DUF4397)